MKISWILVATLLVLSVPSAIGQVTPSGGAGATSKPSGGIPAIAVTAILRTSLSSNGSKEGAEVRATLRKAITLSNGEMLPKETVILGRVAQVSAHQKGKPNGALLLVFDQARKKDGSMVPVIVQIRSLASSVESETGAAKIQLPGVSLGGTANSGGVGQLEYENNDHTASLSSNTQQSGLPGVLLRWSAGGSGMMMTLDANLYLDSGTQLNLLIAPSSGKP